MTKATTWLQLATVLFATLAASQAAAQMRITEWAYSGDEFVEFTNVGGAPVDMTGWSYSDDGQMAGEVDLSAFGLVAPGESVILSEVLADDFRLTWSLPATVKVIGGNTVNLGRNDAINLYDASNTLHDALDYGDQDFPGSPRTDAASANPKNLAALGADDPTMWVLSAVGDAFGSYQSFSIIGNPGSYNFVPEPGALVLAGFATASLVVLRRRRTQ